MNDDAQLDVGQLKALMAQQQTAIDEINQLSSGPTDPEPSGPMLEGSHRIQIGRDGA